MRCVEQIRCIRAELQVKTLCQIDCAEQAEIHVHGPWSQERVASYVSVSLVGLNCCKRARIIVFLPRSDAAKLLYWTDLVRCLALADCVQQRAIIRQTERLTGNGAEDSAGLPSAEDFRGHTAGRPRFALAERQLIDVGHLENLRGVIAGLCAVPPQNVGIVPAEAGPPIVIRGVGLSSRCT